jgi:hypothetical protein
MVRALYVRPGPCIAQYPPDPHRLDPWLDAALARHHAHVPVGARSLCGAGVAADPGPRILARCTRDINAVDTQIPQQIGSLIDLTSVMLTRLVGVVIFTPIFIVPGVLLAVVGGFCGQLYIKAQLAVKRHMSVAHAPVLGHFGAAIAGMGAWSRAAWGY